jgi:hypothetical protein
MKHYKDSKDNLFGREAHVSVPADWVEITLEEARAINERKNPTPAPVELTPTEKLARAGLTVEELRALLA